ncbi:TolC family protein [Empedobacter brevis]|uniref:TolC family protein n=1 Tax=Empedobacter brevis TaxID=247 RepID=UPI0028D41DC8|nr:TolC family protein [Empedobacter brevis]
MAKTNFKLVLSFFLLLIIDVSAQENKIRLSLQDCIDIVKNDNYIIKNSRIDIKVSEEKIREAEKNWIPNINAYFNNYYNLYSHNHDLDEIYFHSDVNSHEAGTENHNHKEHFNRLYSEYKNEFGLETNVLLYNYNSLKIKKEKSRLDNNASIYKSLDIENKIIISLNELYFEALLNNEILKISDNNVKNIIDLFNITQKKYKVGVITKFELNQVKQEYNSAIFDLAEKRMNLELSIFNLINFLQKDYKIHNIELSEDLSNVMFGNILYTEETIKETISDYPSLLAEKNNLFSIQYETKLLKNRLKPKIFGFYSIGSNYIGSLETLIKNDPLLTQWKNNFTNRIGIGISIPILNEYSIKSSILQANLNEEKQKNVLLNEENNLYKLIMNEILMYNNGIELMKISEEKVLNSKEVYDMSFIAYQSGVINLYDLNKSRYDNIANITELANLKIKNLLKLKMIEVYTSDR